VSYLVDELPDDSLDVHAVLKGELTGFYRKATVVVSYLQSGADDGVFLPEGSFDWDGYVGGNFSESLPDAAAAFAELRLADLSLRDWGRVDIVHRYHAAGPEFVNRLSGMRPGEVSNTAGLFVRHRTLAIDGRLVYRKRVRHRFISLTTEHLEAHARVFLNDGSEVYVRGAVGHRDEPGDVRTNDNFIHAALHRSMGRLEAGAHVMARDIEDGDFQRRFGLEARINWNARTSVYVRLISTEDATSHDAAFCQLEVRPARHVFATIGYGRRAIGDGPYVVEDLDLGDTGDIESVYTFSVRGDF
jgi:hypothetical protein